MFNFKKEEEAASVSVRELLADKTKERNDISYREQENS